MRQDGDMAGSVTQRVLGDRFAGLDPRLQRYFSLPPDGMVGEGSGVYSVAGSRHRWLRPVWSWLAWRRVLFPEFGYDVPFRVVNTPLADGSLRGERSFAFPEVERIMVDRMFVVGGCLHDRLGRRGGLEVRLALSVDGGELRMRSERLWIRLAGVRIPLPPVAVVTLREQAIESGPHGTQRVDVRIRSALLGELFRYTGEFAYDLRPA